MPCPKCHEEVVLRIIGKKLKRASYKCPKCGHKWKEKNALLVRKDESQNQVSTVRQDAYGSPWGL